MNENLFQAQYDLTKKSKLKKFYDEKKYLILSTLSICIFVIIFLGIYIENKEKKKINLGNNYIQEIPTSISQILNLLQFIKRVIKIQ